MPMPAHLTLGGKSRARSKGLAYRKEGRGRYWSRVLIIMLPFLLIYRQVWQQESVFTASLRL